MYEKKSYKLMLTTEMLGTVTKDPEVYKTYIESKKPESKNGEDEYLTVEKMEEKGWTGFHSDEEGLFLYEYMIKGFLKEAGNTLKDVLKVKALKSKIDKFLFVAPRRIYLNQDTPDGIVERSLRAMTMQGPRVTLARSDKINAGKVIGFTLTLIPNKDLTWEVIDQIFGYGELSGLGQFRNGGYGRFKVIECKEVK